MNRSSLTRALVTVTLAGLSLAGCSGGGDGGDGGGASPSPSVSPSPSTTVSIPAGQSLTEQGTGLKFGDTATVVFEPTKNAGSVLRLTVDGARKAALSDFKGFILDDPYKKNANYYYVDVAVKNVGKGDVGGVPVPLWGVNGDNTLLPAVNFTTTFKPCPSKPLPQKFGPGDTLKTCLVYLSPDQGSLDSVSYRPSQEFNPITWTGALTGPSAKPSATKSAKKG